MWGLLIKWILFVIILRCCIFKFFYILLVPSVFDYICNGLEDLPMILVLSLMMAIDPKYMWFVSKQHTYKMYPIGCVILLTRHTSMQKVEVPASWYILYHVTVIWQFYVRWLLGLNLFCSCSGRYCCFSAQIVISYIFKNESEKKIAQTTGKAGLQCKLTAIIFIHRQDLETC
jgi:hypothetical protein